MQLLNRQASAGHRIEDLEGVDEVEIGVLGELDLSLLDLPLVADDGHQEVNQVLLGLVLDQRLIDFLHE